MIVLRNLRHELADRRAWWTLCALFFLGLTIRFVFLNRAGTSDIDIDLQWGKDANTFGLPFSYHGNYFPFQYQIFQVAAASGYPVSSLVVFKTINLIADIGVFVVLVLLLRRWRLNVLYACLYWLHPYFLAMFWLGYVDVQFVFFILLGLLALTRAVVVRDYLLAGVPFGLAWLMKPQPLIGAVMIILFGTVLLFEGKFASSRESEVPGSAVDPRVSTLFAASAVRPTVARVCSVATTLLGALSILLIGLLALRHAGPAAGVVTSLVYATYPQAVDAEHRVFLEPPLNLCS